MSLMFMNGPLFLFVACLLYAFLKIYKVEPPLVTFMTMGHQVTEKLNEGECKFALFLIFVELLDNTTMFYKSKMVNIYLNCPCRLVDNG